MYNIIYLETGLLEVLLLSPPPPCKIMTIFTLRLWITGSIIIISPSTHRG
jgi:hypothetical protein